MIDFKKRIAVIEKFVVDGSVQSLTYAALECRLTIEQICYDRLLISHDYISRADLKKWTPAQVVKQIAEEANEHVASGLTLHISKTPVDAGSQPMTVADYEALEYVQVGKQVGFKIRDLNSLWQGLSKVALHINVPEEKQPLSMYGNPDAIKSKVNEAIEIFKNFELESLVIGSIAPVNSFECVGCGTQIRRNAKLLKDGQVISCFKPSCDETYIVSRDGDQITYVQRLMPIVCKACAHTNFIQTKTTEMLRYPDALSATCVECNETTLVRLQLVQETPPSQ